MNHRQVIAAIFMAALLGAFGTGTTWLISGNTHPPAIGHYTNPIPAATDYAAAQGATVVYETDMECGEPLTDPTLQIVGCYRQGDELFIATGLRPSLSAWAIYHELGHYLSARDGLNWTEADCDNYADKMTY